MNFVQQQDTAHYHKMFEENISLVTYIIKRYFLTTLSSYRIEFEDLFQVGGMGLYKAILNYDPFGFFNLCTLSLEGNQKTAKVGAVLPSGGSPPSSWIFENSILTPPLHSTKKEPPRLRMVLYVLLCKFLPVFKISFVK